MALDTLIFDLEYTLVDFLLPFLLLFTIFYSVLSKTKILKSKQANLIVSLVLSLMTVIPHITGRYPPCLDVIEIMKSALPHVGIIALIMVLMLVFIGILTRGAFMGVVMGILAVLSVALTGYFFIESVETCYGISSGYLDWLYIILGVFVFILFIAALWNPPPAPAGP